MRSFFFYVMSDAGGITNRSEITGIEMDFQNIGKVSRYLVNRNKLRLNLDIPASVAFRENLHFHSLLLTILLAPCPSC